MSLHSSINNCETLDSTSLSFSFFSSTGQALSICPMSSCTEWRGMKSRHGPCSPEAHTPKQLKCELASWRIWVGRGQWRLVYRSGGMAPARPEGSEGTQQAFLSWGWLTKDDACASIAPIDMLTHTALSSSRIPRHLFKWLGLPSVPNSEVWQTSFLKAF